MGKYRLKERFLLRVSEILLPFLIRILGATWRIEHVGRDNEYEAGVPMIWVFWHSRMLPLVYAFGGRGIVVLVSRSFDGEIISRALERFGFRTIRGSSSRGGIRSLVSAIAEIREDNRVAFTPYGPRGPAEIAKPGAAAAAVKTGAPVVPAVTSASSFWKLRSWDGFRIPKPFARVEIHQGEPIHPGGRDIDELNRLIQDGLSKLSDEADRSAKKKRG